MGLKILHSADWHLDAPFGGFTQEQREALRREQLLLPDKIVSLAQREKCGLILLAGDLFDGQPSPQTVEQVRRALGGCGIRVLIAPGNHDFYGPDSVWQQERWPDNVYIFKSGLKAISLPDLDCRIYGAAFRSMDCPSLLEGFHAEGEETYKIAVLHGDPTQRNSPYNPVTTAQVRGSGLSYLALGHIHAAGAFRSGETICAWPGCPMGRGWDETGEKGVCVVTLDQKPSIQAVSLDTVRFLSARVDIGDDAAAAIEAALPGAGSRDFYRIDLTGCGKVDTKALKEKFPGFPNLELRDQTEPPFEIWPENNSDTLEGVYFGMLRRRMEQEPENAQRIQRAAEISRRLLLGREVTL